MIPNVNPAVRNVAIVLILAALVVAVPGGGTGANVALQAVALVFLGAMAWVGSRLYREHRVAIYSLGDTRRTIAYVALGAATLVLSASGRLLNTGVGTIVWLVLLGACAYAVFAVIWSARQY
jgi:hypothetical protein